MNQNSFVIRGRKIVTVGEQRTVDDGAMAVESGSIIDVGKWERLEQQYPQLEVIDHSDLVITPSLVDCHTHLLEFAPTSLYPDSPINHFVAGTDLLFRALASGITALGEHICGHPDCNFSVAEYRRVVTNMPIDVSFATTSISIGFEELAHFSAITRSRNIEQQDLVDPLLVRKVAQESDFPGENIFINATPANFTDAEVPRAGEVIYTLEQLKEIVEIFHQSGKMAGIHVAGEQGIRMALDAGFAVLHHVHGITDALIEKVAEQSVKVVATPIGGTHLKPNSPEEILKLIQKKIPVSISTDAYLPPYPGVSWLLFEGEALIGPDKLMAIAQPAMLLLRRNRYDENEILALLTANPAEILGKADRYGKLEKGMEANFSVSEGVPGLDIIEPEQIKKVYYRGRKVVDRG